MRIANLLPLTVVGLVGCAGHQPLSAPALSDWVNAAPDQVLTTAAAAFKERGYNAFLGNPGMVVASKSESTFWTVPAGVAGFALLPVRLITWPVVSLLDNSMHHEVTMWWPLRSFAWQNSTMKDTQIWLKAVPHSRGGSWVTVEVFSPDKAPQYHARQVVDSLFELEPKPLQADSTR